MKGISTDLVATGSHPSAKPFATIGLRWAQPIKIADKPEWVGG